MVSESPTGARPVGSKGLGPPREPDLRALLEGLPGMAYRAGAEPTRALVYVSEGVRDLTGYTVDAFTSGRTTWRSLVHSDDAAAVEHAVASALREQRGFSLVHRIVHASGAVRWVMDRCRLVDDAFEGFVSDVTRVQQQAHDPFDPFDMATGERAQAALREKELLLRNAHESLSMALRASQAGLWDWDMTKEQAYVSPEYRDLYGLPAEEPFSYAQWLAYIEPQDRERVEAYGREVFAHGTEYVIEFRIDHPTRGQRWLDSLGRLYRDAEGRPVRFSGINLDITERKRAEQARQESEERIRSVIDSMFAYVWMLAPDGTLIEANRAPVEGLGLCRSDVLGKEFWECPWWTHDPSARARVVAAFERAVRGEVVRHDETSGAADGGRMILDFQLQPVFEGDQLRFVIASAVDVTTRKRAEDAVRTADRRKDEFLATLAHELRNPLAPLRTGLEVMKGSNAAGTHERAREMMERQLHHMVRLVDDLLDVARINRGQLNLARELVSLQVVGQHAIEITSPLIEACKHTLAIHMPDQPVWVDGDLTRLTQVVGNLLHNATKYTPTEGHLELAVSVEDGCAVMRVRDDGIGMRPTILPQVFDLFARAASDPERSRGGLGIGLFLARRLVEMHGGTITAQSPGEGLGSTFTIRLPLAAGPRPPAKERCEGAPAATTSRRILVVDDNEEAAELLAILLELRGHQTRIAHDGASALVIAREFSPDVALLDLGLPGMSGHELARRFRADAALAGTVLIALTGWGGSEDRRRTQEAGFDHHLTKPADIATIEGVLAQH